MGGHRTLSPLGQTPISGLATPLPQKPLTAQLSGPKPAAKPPLMLLKPICAHGALGTPPHPTAAQKIGAWRAAGCCANTAKFPK